MFGLAAALLRRSASLRRPAHAHALHAVCRIACGAVVAATAATASAARVEASSSPVPADAFPQWALQLETEVGEALGERLDVHASDGTVFDHKRTDKQLIWQTLREGSRRIKRVSIWRWRPVQPEMVGGGESAVAAEMTHPASRLRALVELGDELNGHPGVVHGGFTAALLDDLFGWTSMAAKNELRLEGMVLTASLNVNYRRPLLADRTYLVDIWVERVEKQRKIFLKANIVDADNNLLVEASALYVIKPTKPEPKAVAARL